MWATAAGIVPLAQWSRRLTRPGSWSAAGTWAIRSAFDQVLGHAVGHATDLVCDRLLWVLHWTQADRLGLVVVLVQTVSMVSSTARELGSGTLGSVLAVAVTLLPPVRVCRHVLRVYRARRVRAGGPDATRSAPLTVQTAVGAVAAHPALETLTGMPSGPCVTLIRARRARTSIEGPARETPDERLRRDRARRRRAW